MTEMIRVIALLLTVTLGGYLSQPVSAQNTHHPVLVMEMKGAIGPAFSDYLKRGIFKAVRDNAQLIVIKLNTPGGLLTSTRDMVSQIIASPVPVAVWVTPSGAHAASAGTFLLYAAHIAAMDEGTNVGAATPIEMGGIPSPVQPDSNQNQDSKTDPAPLTLSDPGKAKAIEDTTAFIRGLAEIRGRNIIWAEKAVTEADSLTAQEAFEINVTEYIAKSLPDLLDQINGKSITVKQGGIVTLKTKDAPVTEYLPDLRTQFLSYITDPNVAFLLMTLGAYGLILEFYNPGTLIPGTIGAISLLIGLFALNILPINAAGIALLVLAMLLIAAEAFVPSFGILGLGGLAAFIVGGMLVFDTSGMPGLALDWQILLGTGLAGLLLIALIVWLTVKAYKRKATTGQESLIGEKGAVLDWDNIKGRVRVQGEEWNAVSSEPMQLNPDDIIRVVEINGLTLQIEPF